MARDGSIDWCVLPRFDSPPLFAGILDCRAGGTFQLRWPGPCQSTRRYLTGTMVLETTFAAEGGRASLTDLLILDGREFPTTARSTHHLLRLLRGLDGHVELDIVWQPYGGDDESWGRASGLARSQVGTAAHGLTSGAGDQVLTLQTPRPSVSNDGTGMSHITIAAGESVAIVQSLGPRIEPEWSIERAQAVLEGTVAGWRAWAGGLSYRGTHADAVRRSALVLKSLIYAPTGAPVAAPTTSLPEWIGGDRNWDYRYSWIRDSSFTVRALLELGSNTEAERYIEWLRQVVETAGGMSGCRVMYSVDASPIPIERVVPGLEGYGGSKPVRVGNMAAGQLQLDVLGEVLELLHAWCLRSPAALPHLWRLIEDIGETAASSWQKPDSGIWEIRAAPRHFVLSKALCWAALERGASLASAYGRAAGAARWQSIATSIHADIMAKGREPGTGAFTQAYGWDAMDASNLRLSDIGFIDGRDPAMISTIDETIERLADGPLVYRYRDAPDGLTSDEGVFLLTGFWLVDALATAGRHREAEDRFERLVALANDVGLLAEEADVRNGAALGNFPQAYSHIGIIQSAVRLSRDRR